MYARLAEAMYGSGLLLIVAGFALALYFPLSQKRARI
jgi:hypothetical protein